MSWSLTRRELLLASGTLALGAAAPSRRPAPSDRLGVGLIGAGAQGGNHLRRLLRNPSVEVRAVCDVYRPRLEAARRMSGADGHRDHRELLARTDVDCVWIVTPDHWHAKMAVEALEAGKDIYCEKPMDRYWTGARAFYEAAERTRRVVQIGAQATSNPKYRAARELVLEGRLGRLLLSQTSLMRNFHGGAWNQPIDDRVGPADLDWDRFLGPAPRRPFDPERFFRWRKYWDYSGGLAADYMSHKVHPLVLATGSEFPVRVVSSGGVLVHPDREVPDTFHALIDFEGGHTLFSSAAHTTSKGLLEIVRGHRAWLDLSRSDELLLSPDELYAEQIDELAVSFPHFDLLTAHQNDFLDCVRRRDPATHCPPSLGYRVAVALDLASRSWRENAVYRFDPAEQRATPS